MHAAIFAMLILAVALATHPVAAVADCPAAVADGPPHVQAIDPTATARLGELARNSTIVGEMLAYLETSAVALTVRSSANLLRDHRAGGLSRFFVDKGVLKGRLEFDRSMRDAARQRITLAHELGHAVELSSLPRRSTASLGNQLLAHIGQHDPWSSQLVIETPFAHAIDVAVNGELKYGAAPSGMLRAIAKRHRVALAGCEPGRRGVAAAEAARTQQQ
jgi:hypothetical protein